MTAENEKMVAHIDTMNTVVAEHLKGETPTDIARNLSMSRQRVVRFLDEWKSMVSDNTAIRNRAHEALASADQHYNNLIGKAYEVMEDAENMTSLGALNTKNNTIKLIADMEAKRIDMLQKSGALDDRELAEEVVRTEKKQEVLEGILKEVIADCEHCKVEVMRRLSKVSNDEAVVIKYDN